jgi:hypothetical protein
MFVTCGSVVTGRLLRLTALIAMLAWSACAWARPLNMVPNPSFEMGTGAPDGWTLAVGTTWAATSAHTGQRSLEARTARPACAAVSRTIPLDPDQSYRLDGWVLCRKGRARLGWEVLDGRGRVVDTAATAWVTPGGAWQFAAAERDMPPRAVAARLWFEVDGQARLDDVAIIPMKANLLYNPTFDVDSKGRVGLWVEEKASLQTGRRAGVQKADPAGGRNGSALLLEAGPSEWWGSRVIPANVPTGITAFRFTGWARAEGGRAGIRVLWLDPWERVIRADPIPAAGPENRGDFRFSIFDFRLKGHWQRYTGQVQAPAGAVQVTVSAAAEGGKAWFDDFSLTSAAPARQKRPVVQVFVNQVGYERAGPKSAVVATNFYPKESAHGWLEVVSESNGIVTRAPLSAARIYDADTADWGSYFWRGDFSSLSRPGRYRAVARVGGVRGESFRFVVGDDAVLRGTGKLGVDFFFVQRCGFAVPGWHKACHLDDALLPDGTHIDATGGWHSAGDYNKIMYENGDGGVAYALFKAYDALPGYFRQYDRDHDGRPDILDEAMWGAQFVAKMQNPKTGGLYNHIQQGPGRTWMKWSPPDVHTDNIVGTADDPVIQPGEGQSPLVIAAWARIGRLLTAQGTQNDYADRALRYWRYLTEKSPPGSSPLLLLTALEMHALTGEQDYFDYAQRSAATLLAQQVRSGRFRGAWGASGEITAGALAAFALASPQDALTGKIRPALAEFRAFLESTADNPFGLSKQSVGEKEYFFEPTSTLGLNFNQLQKAWAAALIARLNHDARALRFATDQVDWVLGKNPYNLCQFEGAGTLNPPRYHHRYDSIPGHERGAVPGTIPNGFVRTISGEDQPGFDMSRPGAGKGHPSYRTSEPWLVHNMWYLLAVSALHDAVVEAGRR